MQKSVLYISYNGLLEPILSSQVIPYLKRLSQDGFKFILLTFEKPKDLSNAGRRRIKEIRSELRKDGIHWIWLLYHKHPDKLSTLLDLLAGALVSIYIFFKYKIKIVHVRGVTPGAIGLFLSKIFVKTKIIFDMRGLLAEEYVGGGIWKDGGIFFNLVKFIESRLIMRADAIIVLTKKHYRMNLELPYFNKNVPMAVIPCCVDLDKFKPEKIERKGFLKRYNIDTDGEILFMYLGKIGTYYLVKEMFEFFNYVNSFMPDSKFIILTSDNPDAFKKLGIAFPKNNIHLLHPSFDEIPLLLRCADAGLFFINSYKKFGSSPIKLGEFLASGKPVVINSGIGDTEELVINNRVGVVIRNFQEKDYLDKFRELVGLLEEGDNLAKRCHDTAYNFLSLPNGVETYKDIYTRFQ